MLFIIKRERYVECPVSAVASRKLGGWWQISDFLLRDWEENVSLSNQLLFIALEPEGVGKKDFGGLHDFQGQQRGGASSPTEYKGRDYGKLTVNEGN